MVSAYFEHRSGKPEIRIIAIVLRSEKAVFQCLFCCDGQKYNSSAVYSIHSDHYKFDYGTADIMCPVPHRCEVPNHIALYIDMPDEEPPFTPVFNLRDRNESFPYEFTVCISTMFDFDNVLQMVQTLEMFRLLGVQRVAIYRNSCSRTAQRVLDHYVKRDFVEVIDWPVTSYLNVSKGWQRSHSPGDLHYYGQIPALNDCVYRYMYQSRYVALQDIDELILPLSVDSWGELLPQLEMAYGPDVGFEFENNVFPSTVKQSNQSTWTDWQGVPGVNILEHVYREPNNPSESNNFKIIVNPRAVFSTTVHTLLHSKMGSVHVDRSVARIFHIRKPVKTDLSQGELILDQRLLYYADSLVPNVSKVLKETLQN